MSFWKRLFGRKKVLPSDQIPTAPLEPLAIAQELHLEGTRHIVVGVAHSIGRERDYNDDSLFVLSGGADGDIGLPDFGLFCVADGLGGYNHGHLASAVAVRSIVRILTRGAFLRLLDLEERDEPPPLGEMVSAAFKEANDIVIARAKGGATTLTAALLLGEQLVIGHVGDTRAYYIHDEDLKLLTSDHSLVQQMIETGEMTEEEAEESPQRGVLWNAMGKTKDLNVDVSYYAVSPGSYLLLCTDGLWGEIPEERMLRIISGSDNPQKTCEALVGAANEAGGHDNITAVLVQFPSEP